MSVATITDAELTGMLKNVYSGTREKLVPIATVLMANIKRAKQGGPRNFQWGGNGVRFNAVMTRPAGMIGSSTGYFPAHHQAKEEQGLFGIKRLYVTREVDGLAITGTQSKQAAFTSLAKKIIEELKDAIELGMNEVLHGNGRAIKALLASTADTTHFVAVSPYGVSGAGQGGLLLDIGMEIAVLDATDSFVTVLGRSAITNVSNSGDNCTVTLGTAIAGMAAGDAVVPCTASDTSLDQYPSGLIDITNRGNAYASHANLSNATYARWDAIRMTTSDVLDVDVVSESDIFDLIMKVKGRSGKDAKSKPGEFLMLGTPGLEKKLVEQFYPQRTLVPSDFIEVKGGFKAVSIFGVPFVSDSWCPAGTVYLIHLPSMAFVDSKDWGEVKYESAAPWRPVSGRDAFQINFGTYLNVGTFNRGAHGSIVGYTDTTRYSLVA